MNQTCLLLCHRLASASVTAASSRNNCTHFFRNFSSPRHRTQPPHAMSRLPLLLAALAVAFAQQKASFSIPVGCIPAKSCTVRFCARARAGLRRRQEAKFNPLARSRNSDDMAVFHDLVRAG